MTRLDLLPENDLPVNIKKILNDIVALKNVQAFGRDSIVPKIVSTEDEYDAVAVNVGGPNPWYLSNELRFTAKTQLNPYGRLFVEIFEMDGTPFPVGGVEIAIGLSRKVVSLSPLVIDFFKDDGLVEFGATFQNGIRRFQVKYYVQTSDDGELELIY